MAESRKKTTITECIAKNCIEPTIAKMSGRKQNKSRSERRKSKAQNDAATTGSESSEATSSRPTSAQSASSSLDNGNISADVVAESNGRKTKKAKKGSKIDLDDIDLQHLSSSVDVTSLNDNQQKAKKNGNPDESTGCAIGGKATGEDKEGASAAADKTKKDSDDDDEDTDDDESYYDTDDSDSSGCEYEYEDPRREIRECLSCGNTGSDLKKCLGCEQAAYCDKKCQIEGWKKEHKKLCAKYRHFSSQLSGVELRKMELRHGPLEKRVSTEYFMGCDQETYDPRMLFGRGGAKQCVILEVVCRHPYIFRSGCIARDADGKETDVHFYTDPNTFLHVGVLAPTKVNISDVMKPGTFFCLIDPVWHHFIDGTYGIRIDEHEEFELL